MSTKRPRSNKARSFDLYLFLDAAKKDVMHASAKFAWFGGTCSQICKNKAIAIFGAQHVEFKELTNQVEKPRHGLWP